MTAGPTLPFDRTAIDGVSLDAGGVMVVPDHGILGHALTVAGVGHDRARFHDGHYTAMAEVDRARSEPETVTDYVGAFLRAVGVADADVAAGARALEQVVAAPVWIQPLPGARAAAARLAAAGLCLAVTSNSDGTVADTLRRHEILQVGEGPGIEVDHISDSGVIGVHKPDAAMFRATADGLGLPAGRICHVGDAGGYDADGATAAGMAAVHLDPLGLCPADHVHVVSLADFVDRLLG
jgi:putative hydrolase of the HAD superfamily